jgi:hypothetical protein
MRLWCAGYACVGSGTIIGRVCEEQRNLSAGARVRSRSRGVVAAYVGVECVLELM